jgi:UDP-N-acetylmuramoyl-L-alanyl-D-glutamate--2,6-diaminopimelate ligase
LETKGGALMRLGALLGNDDATNITAFAIDHRKVAPGTVFGAFQGNVVNGEDFIPAAIAAGAVAVVARHQAQVEGAVHIVSDDPRRAFALLAAQFFAPFPETIVAVTGTNGKTSCVEMTRQLWRLCGYSAASIGTLGVTTPDEQVKTGLTSPDIATFLANMGGLQREGVTHVAFEASSHGLHQYRAEGPHVAAGAFTNISRDHLDYHGDMANYLTAKLRLFSEVIADDGTAVIWADDPKACTVINLARERGLTLLRVGEKGEELRLVSRETSQLGQTLMLEVDGKAHKVSLPLIGAYQAANALVSAGLVIATGGDVATTLANLSRLQPVRGRLERAVINRAGAPVYVDYAHTPDALEAAIAALRPHANGRIILVFGAGGDRDTGKRKEMGKVAARDADIAIVTDDNPRSEDPALIRKAIMAGCPGATEMDGRRDAIAAAVSMAGANDIVLIAGKGHEQGQIVGDRVLPFDDVTVARECAA